MSFLETLAASSIPSAILGILGGILFKNYIPEKIRHYFQKDIESIKNTLNSQENELSAIRSGSLQNIAKKEIIVFEKALGELDSLMLVFQKLRPYYLYVGFFSRLRIDKLEELHASDPKKVSDLCDALSGKKSLEDITAVLNDYPIKSAYIPDTIWAYFDAYSSVLSHVFIVFDLFRLNIENPLPLYKKESINDLIEKTIPGFLVGVNPENVSIFLSDFLKKIDELLTEEIRKFLNLEVISTDSLIKAKQICISARNMQQETSNAQTKSHIPPSYQYDLEELLIPENSSNEK